MTNYALYLESGPQHKKTMVHVLDLLGCVIRGRTTDEALAGTPAGIQAYLHFLQASGEPFDAAAPFTTHIETHLIGSTWIGEGNPACGFAPDFESLSRHDFNNGNQGRFRQGMGIDPNVERTGVSLLCAILGNRLGIVLAAGGFLGDPA